ncbi:MAG: hypothetical protein ABI863_05615 [Ginsengibacter sp.]
MKTSNKILLGILLIGFGYLACAQIALHIKYINNDFTDPAKFNAHFNNQYTFHNVSHVRLTGLAECNIIFSDSVKLSVEKSGINYVKFAESGDTLIINDGSYSDISANSKLNRSPQNVKLYLPAGIDVFAINSNINVKGNNKNDNGYSYRFDLTGCNLFTRYNNGIDSLDRYFNNLTVHAGENSQVILFRNDHFKTLDMTLDHSMINDYHAKIEQMNIITDSSSFVVVTGGNITKVNARVIRKPE